MPARTALLVLPEGSWDAPHHALEVGIALAAARPGVVQLWCGPSVEDRWLAAHDVAAAGLGGVARVVGPDGVDRTPNVVVLTGYSHGVLPRTAIGVHAVGFAGDHLETGVDPFDVEGLVAAVLAALPEEITGPARRRGR